MIHRIEPGYLRTNDALNKRDRRQGRRRPHDTPADEHDESDERPTPAGERESTLDLVA